MSRIQCRGAIAGAAIVVALLFSGPARAQVGVDPGPPREPRGLCNDLITGVEYDVLNQALAEKHLQKLQAKLRFDSERGDRAAVNCDLRKIDNLKYRIVMDEWLIRWNSRYYPCFYPIRTDEVSCAAIAQAASPTEVPNIQMSLQTPEPTAPSSTISITIVNAEQAGAAVEYAIDGITHQAAAGSREELTVAPGAHITYDVGGSLGQRRYLLSPGRYEFRSTADGWALHKLADTP